MTRKTHINVSRYARVLSHYPYLVVLVILVVVAACLVVTLTHGHGLDFDDPLAGFEPRGTELSDRLVTFENLVNNVGEKTNLLPFVTNIQKSGGGRRRRLASDLSDPGDPRWSHSARPGRGGPPDLVLELSLGLGGPPGLSAADGDDPPASPTRAAPGSGHLKAGVPGRLSPPGVDAETLRRIQDRREYAERRTSGGGSRGGERARWSRRNRERGRKSRARNVNSSRMAVSLVNDDPSRDSNRTRSKLRVFCEVPDKSYSRLIVSSSHGRSLFNEDDLKAMCRLEATYFRSWPGYAEVCVRDSGDGQCCPAWSLANYVALLSGRDRCEDITSQDVTAVHALLSQCAPFFHNFSLGPNCAGRHTAEEWFTSRQYPVRSCPRVPKQCSRYNAVYHILHFLSDSNFMHPDPSSYIPSPGHAISLGRSESFLKYSVIFLPVAAGASAVNLFDHLDSLPRTVQGISVVGAHFGVKYSLFERYLIADSFWIGLACAVIFLGMWIYTSSLFVTVMAFLSIFWAVEVAYFLYTFVFKIEFFPYMNMVTLIVMVGVGADDLFIYCKVWHLAKAEKNNGMLEKIIGDTLRHTALSMLVTSLTSAAAFYANYISDITSIRCFSVFAGTCIVINFLLTVTWLPASVMLHERWLRCCSGLHMRSGAILCLGVSTLPYKVYFLICDWSRIFFEKLLPCLVIKFRFMWIAVFGSLWVASVVVIFYYPRLKLPNTRKFQVFSSDHLSERYDFQFGELFDFEKVKDGDDVPVFPITVVWGVTASDTGDPLNPFDKGSLTFDPHFDLTSSDAQEWLLGFCSRLRSTDFYVHVPGIRLTDCFLENFVNGWMKQPCHEDNMECCNQTSFPFQKAVLMRCLSDYIPALQATPGVYYNSHTPGPRFSNGRISAFFVQFLSNQTFSHSYAEVEKFYMHVNSWVEQEMRQAPPEMARGWFVSHLHFYDLQSSLAMGTPLALGVSLTVVAIVAFFTTLNVLVSVYALLAVGGAISATMAALVLLGWTLDILESVVITVAVGLAIDMTLHYGVAFRLAPDTGREMRVVCSLGRMGSPVSMAAVTTMLAGAFMMPSTVLAYRKFGTFLLLLVSLAWLYATFFFQSLLRIAGPHGGFGQFHWPAWDCCSPGGSREHVDKTVYSMSESTLSSSSTSAREHSHGHSYVYTQELEPLTSTSGRERRSSHHHNPRQYCPKHHPHRSLQTQTCSTKKSSSSLPEKRESSNRPPVSQSHHNHHQNHHHHHCHHQNVHGRQRLKGDYTQVRTTAEVVSKSEGEHSKPNVACPDSSPSCSLLEDKAGSTDTATIAHSNDDKTRHPADPSILVDSSILLTAVDISSPHLVETSPTPSSSSAHLSCTPTLQPPCSSQDNILTTPSNSSTLSPSPLHARLSSSDLSETSEHKPVSSDSEAGLGQSSGHPTPGSQVELLPHTQPVPVS